MENKRPVREWVCIKKCMTQRGMAIRIWMPGEKVRAPEPPARGHFEQTREAETTIDKLRRKLEEMNLAWDPSWGKEELIRQVRNAKQKMEKMKNV